MQTPPIPLLDFAPDLDSSTEGVVTDMSNFVPLTSGYAGKPRPTFLTGSAIDEEIQGLALVLVTNGSARLFIGTASKIEEFSGSSLSDRSRVGGYTAGANRWRWAAYGDFVYATDKIDAVQKSTGGAFADQATIPKCDFIDRIGDFLIIASTNEATNGDQNDRWWCSALGNTDDFVPSIATQCVTNRLTDSPGPITASKGLGDNWIIYKANALYKGTYQGPPDVWAFERVSTDVGCISSESIITVGYSHFFLGNDNFYVFDGALPRPIPNNLRNWFFDRLQRAYAYKTQGLYDRARSMLYWFFPGPTGDGALSEYMAFNLKTGKWATGETKSADLVIPSYAYIQAACDYVTGGMTFDQFWPPTGGTTWDGVPSISYDSPFFLGGTVLPLVGYRGVPATPFQGLATLNGAATGAATEFPAYLTTGDIGDDANFSTLARVLPRFLVTPTSGTLTHYYRQVLGGPLVTNPNTAPYNAGRFYVPEKSARWHRVKMSFVGDVEMTQLAYELEPDGEE